RVFVLHVPFRGHETLLNSSSKNRFFVSVFIPNTVLHKSLKIKASSEKSTGFCRFLPVFFEAKSDRKSGRLRDLLTVPFWRSCPSRVEACWQSHSRRRICNILNLAFR